ncbi:beta-N-acetylhexosaminidase [Phytoactinopolyspora halotolerans]|uniref:beta-N-acetylhexosaminidase n=1 Tax=Phytoactinopolyspora halotolerans TaxID=1981512 RepID=A0A6L9S5V0_9ACTN|nr:beta-N-acetylhexosaminidase [Phytoactinopolyspora halotolerans]NEE00363.1 beta-N-acetylhexosaminidase [Phytoactinopolyspora halotolerans]
MPLDLIPQPRSVVQRPGTFAVRSGLSIAAEGDAVGPAWLLHDVLRAAAGIAAPVLPHDATAAIRFQLSGAGTAEFPSPAAERYRLDVTEDAVTVSASHPSGLVRAVQTIRQLLPADGLRAAPVAGVPVQLPCVTIDDEPHFGWRGVMLDVARHFQPKDFLLRLIDLAALHQLNVVHLHLTDDQGWRLEVPGWPRLTEVGSWRPETVVGHAASGQGFDGTPHGGYYTAADLKEVVAYAAARHITVVPEIDMPGHVRSVLAAYPELGNTDTVHPVATTFGIFPEVLAPTDEALRFARDVFDVVTEIFDAPYIHIGGDECPRSEWRESAQAKARADELGLDSTDRLQSWFTASFADHLRAKGRRVIGWDEILEDGGAPRDAVISVWREFATAAKALAAGHDVIVAPQKAVYLDWYESDGPDEPLHIHGHLPLETIAEFDPAPSGAPEMDAAGSGTVLGVQAQLWTEYLPTPRHVEYAAFPRLAAVADMAWSGLDARREHPIATRLATHVTRLDALGVNYRPTEGPHPWQRGGTGPRARFDRA